MYQLYNTFICIILSLCSFFLFDLLLILFGDNNKKRRWFFTHAITNTFITIYTFENLIICFSDPLSLADDDKYDFLPMNVAISLHLFHLISSYNNLTIIDWIHHLVSCLFCGFISQIFVNGKMTQYALFFLCGLPGGIDYYLLTLNKYGIINKITEKKINVYLNMCIRLPGILFGTFASYICLLYNLDKNMTFIQSLVLTIINLLNTLNVLYFAIRVVQNYGTYIEYSSRKKVLSQLKRSKSLNDLSKNKDKDKDKDK
jgi:hypothetical protein